MSGLTEAQRSLTVASTAAQSRTVRSSGNAPPKWLLYLLVIAVWVQPLATGNGLPPVGTIVLALTVALLFLSLIVPRARDSFNWSQGLGQPLLMCYLAGTWVTVGGVVGGIPLSRFYDWFTIGLSLTIGAWISAAAQSRATLLRATFLAMCIWITAVVAQVFLSPSLFGLNRVYETDRATGLHYNPNGAATFLLTGTLIVLAVAMNRNTPRWSRVRHWALAIAGAWSLVETGSRGALSAIVVGAAVLLILRLGGVFALGRDYFQLLMAIGAAAFVAYWLPILSEGLLGRDTSSEDLASSRGELWGEASRQILESPWFGVPRIELQGGLQNAHNAFLEAGLRFGMFGGALFVLLLLLLVTRAWNHERVDAGSGSTVAVALLIGLIVYGMTHAVIVENSFLWIVAGAFALRAPGKRENPVPDRLKEH